jgi:putative heme-binding domain-containing protein
MTSEPEAADAILAILGQAEDPWLTSAVLCSTSRSPSSFWARLVQRRDWLAAPTSTQARFLERLGEQLGLRRQGDESEFNFRWLFADDDEQLRIVRIAVLAGIVRSFRGSGLEPGSLGPALADSERKPRSNDADNRFAFPASLISAAARSASQSELDLAFRLQAIDVLAWYGRSAKHDDSPEGAGRNVSRAESVGRLLIELLSPTHTPAVQVAAARALALIDHPASSRAVYERWSQLGAAARQEVFAHAPRSRSAATSLLDSLQRQVVLPAELPVSVRAGLAESKVPEVKELAIKLLATAPLTDRRAVVGKYQSAMRIAGDAQRGAALLKEHCLSCHVMQGIGVRVGPDLTGIGSRRNDILLADILDPGRNVTPDFLHYVLTTKSGQVFAGMISAETEDSVTLRRAGGESDTIFRAAIQELRGTGKSMMPDGLEEKLNVQQLADVLEFLRRPQQELLK